ncbi:MAG: malate synthase A [Gammaproteobacteria bacterium]
MEIPAHIKPDYAEILTGDALAFVTELVELFSPRVRELLALRQRRQSEMDRGVLPGFPAETDAIRRDDWKVAPLPADLLDRRVEITGPVDRKMIVNGLNSGANVFMADFEDASSPTWDVMLQGQVNLRDAVNRKIDFTAENGKRYRLHDHPAVLMVRPRGWHLPEGHARLHGLAVPAALWDFGLYFFHNARALADAGSAPSFYLPKLQGYLEARLWNDVFIHAQDALGIPRGTVKATVLIETLPAAFEMDEILYELKDHSAGLNCGRWDYIFSYIKCFRHHPERILPNRDQVTMTSSFLDAYSRLVIRTCHRRGVHAIGGMAAQIPVKGDRYLNEAAMRKVRDDKEREVLNGHDGSWISHPAFVAVCKDVFDLHMPGPNQIHKQPDGGHIGQEELLRLPEGTITIQGVMKNVSAALSYIRAWLAGQGAVPLHHLMEDAATAEISRTQLWQWIHSPGGVLADGRRITTDLFRAVLGNELDRQRLLLGGRFDEVNYKAAAGLLDGMVSADALADFLTLEAYPLLSGRG